MVKGEKHITLREAAELSGYSPDYLGQLIRKGKLQGEQVFSHVAWMTTEAAVLEYTQKIKAKKSKNASVTDEKGGGFATSLPWEKLTKVALWFTIALIVGFVTFLFYVTSVAIDDALERRALTTMGETAHAIR